MGFIDWPPYKARDAAEEPEDVLTDRLRHTGPLAAIWIGGFGLAVLFILMVFKPF